MLLRRCLPGVPKGAQTDRLGRRMYHLDASMHGARYPLAASESANGYTAKEQENRAANASLLQLVTAFRAFGHSMAHVNPLKEKPAEAHGATRPEVYRLASKEYRVAGILAGHSDDAMVSLEAIIAQLERTYCGGLAFEFEHLPIEAERRWLAHAAETAAAGPALTREQKLRIHELLSRSEAFDHFMAQKFPMVKRYGLEGAESMMVVLDQLFGDAAQARVRDIVLCMPHRGRLNLLTDLLKFDARALFSKLKGNAEFPEGVPATGDVLSHLATSVELEYGPDSVHVSLLHNPSHLEAVNPVAVGKTRARQTGLGVGAGEAVPGDKALCVQLHGDAAFCGQGVVMETLAMSSLPHYTVGGSVHVIVNNQIGYTTPGAYARSTTHSSDVARLVHAPVIRVNGNEPELVVRAASIALAYRQVFRKDIVIDLIGFRRMGHNELDEPAFTQPLMYRNIRARKSVSKLYAERLVAEGILDAPAKAAEAHQARLGEALEASYAYTPVADTLQGRWKEMQLAAAPAPPVETGVDEDALHHVGNASIATPADFRVHPRIAKFHIEHRLQRVRDGERLDWALAEALAFGTLMLDGYDVRISGQDVGRGTFSQRHAMLVNQDTGRVHVPLNSLASAGNAAGALEIANSPLSEFAVMGFEYGVSIETPKRLCIWEAQFGDFFNGAQIIIDTFIASGEAKWLRQSGLVLLLPHGYDGAGPEHSSCRIERFLQLADDPSAETGAPPTRAVNMHIVNCTTPAQYFHVLRRQMLWPFRKPLIVAAPKLLLKHPAAISTFADMGPGTAFRPVLPDDSHADAAAASRVRRVVLTSGKVYYELAKRRAESPDLAASVALVRVEELCPFPLAELSAVLERYSSASEIVWCQEEPHNQGPWPFCEPRLRHLVASLPNRPALRYVGRGVLPAPAVGISSWHKAEEASLLARALQL